RKVDEYYHSHIFTKYYLYDYDLGNINIRSDNGITTEIEFSKRLNINDNNIGINLPSLLKDMINAFNNDEWVKSQGITITSLSATLLATIGFYKIDKIRREIYTACTLDKIKIDFNFQKRNKHRFRMSFEYYLVNNMKSSIRYGSPVSTTTTWQTLANGTNVFKSR
ncbi:MAG: hypothetical protein ACP5RD_07065, partial [bacterium]